jgi:hypothetical protein
METLKSIKLVEEDGFGSAERASRVIKMVARDLPKFSVQAKEARREVWE